MAIQTFYERYNELKEKYKIARTLHGLIPPEITDPYAQKVARQNALAKFDVVIESAGRGYGHTKYRVVKNGPGLSTKDLAIICDNGNLCFGYRMEGSDIICVYTD